MRRAACCWMTKRWPGCARASPRGSPVLVKSRLDRYLASLADAEAAMTRGDASGVPVAFLRRYGMRATAIEHSFDGGWLSSGGADRRDQLVRRQRVQDIAAADPGAPRHR